MLWHPEIYDFHPKLYLIDFEIRKQLLTSFPVDFGCKIYPYHFQLGNIIFYIINSIKILGP